MDFVSDITLEDLQEIGITKLGTEESNSETINMFGQKVWSPVGRQSFYEWPRTNTLVLHYSNN